MKLRTNQTLQTKCFSELEDTVIELSEMKQRKVKKKKNRSFMSCGTILNAKYTDT